MPFRRLRAHDRQRVEVRSKHDLWVVGVLEATREIGGVPYGLVRYSTGPGETHAEWFRQDQLRAMTDAAAAGEWATSE